MPATVLLENLDRVGASDFRVGERILVSITGGTPDGVVTNTAWLNGESLGTTTYGTINAYGEFYLLRTMGPQDVGAWVEIWKIDDVPVEPTQEFQVAPAVTPTGTDDPIILVAHNFIFAQDNLPGTEDLYFDVVDVTTKKFLGTGFFLGIVQIQIAALAWNKCSSTGFSLMPTSRRNYVY